MGACKESYKGVSFERAALLRDINYTITNYQLLKVTTSKSTRLASLVVVALRSYRPPLV